MLTLILTGCTQMDWFFGVNEDGTDKPGESPASYLALFLENLGPLGGLAAAGLATGGAAYVGRKRGDKLPMVIIEAIEKIKSEVDEKEAAWLVGKLKAKIPNKYHKAIDKIRDTI